MNERTPRRKVAMLHRVAIGLAGLGVLALGWVLRTDGTPTSLLINCLIVVLFFGAAITGVVVVAYRIDSNSPDPERNQLL